MHLEEQMSYAKQRRQADRDHRRRFHEQPADGSLSIVERMRQTELADEAAELRKWRQDHDRMSVHRANPSIKNKLAEGIGGVLLTVGEKHNDWHRTQHYRAHKSQYEAQAVKDAAKEGVKTNFLSED